MYTESKYAVTIKAPVLGISDVSDQAFEYLDVVVHREILAAIGHFVSGTGDFGAQAVLKTVRAARTTASVVISNFL